MAPLNLSTDKLVGRVSGATCKHNSKTSMAMEMTKYTSVGFEANVVHF